MADIKLNMTPEQRDRLFREAQEASRRLRDDPEEQKLLDEVEELQAQNGEALRED